MQEPGTINDAIKIQALTVKRALPLFSLPGKAAKFGSGKWPRGLQKVRKLIFPAGKPVR